VNKNIFNKKASNIEVRLNKIESKASVKSYRIRITKEEKKDQKIKDKFYMNQEKYLLCKN
jgi:hypothetical protein